MQHITSLPYIICLYEISSTPWALKRNVIWAWRVEADYLVLMVPKRKPLITIQLHSLAYTRLYDFE